MTDWREHVKFDSDVSGDPQEWFFASTFGQLGSGVRMFRTEAFGHVEEPSKLLEAAGALADPVVTMLKSPITGDYSDHGESIFVTADGVISIAKSYDGRWVAKASGLQEEFVKSVSEMLSGFFSSRGPSGSVAMAVVTRGGLQLRELGIVDEPLKEDNYEPDVVAGFHQVVNDLSSKTPPGRLSLLSGPPGTGKSFFMRAVISAAPTDVRFVVLPASAVGSISAPSLLTTLIEEGHSKSHPTCLILEDADRGLAIRGPENFDEVTDLLNVGDGLLGELADLRVIATTNATRPEIDPAILRPGRLAHRIEFGPLDTERARLIVKREGGDPAGVTHPVVLGEAYAVARGEKASARRNSVGFSQPS